MSRTKLLPSSLDRKPRALRADARRNRERILEVAKLAFTEHGADATLDDIARRTGIGPGTLYRHFPTRDALIEAVYRSEVEKLAGAEARFAESMPPLEPCARGCCSSSIMLPARRSLCPLWTPFPGALYV